MTANALVREPEIQKLWEDNQVFKRVVDKNDGVGGFVAGFICVFSYLV
jgi:isoleucyl-tRNA synthetase